MRRTGGQEDRSTFGFFFISRLQQILFLNLFPLKLIIPFHPPIPANLSGKPPPLSSTQHTLAKHYYIMYLLLVFFWSFFFFFFFFGFRFRPGVSCCGSIYWVYWVYWAWAGTACEGEYGCAGFTVRV